MNETRKVDGEDVISDEVCYQWCLVVYLVVVVELKFWFFGE